MGAVVVNEVRRGFYLDSVALMRVARAVASRDGVEEAALMMGTPANRQIMEDAEVLDAVGAAAESGDLVLAVRASTGADAAAAIAEATRLMERPRSRAEAASWRPRTIRHAIKSAPDSNLALISVPGEFAVAEARKAIESGLHAMIFSDNVPLEEERALKEEARAHGLLVMGPDCGTAIIGGAPIAFANAVSRGDIGIIGASGTGIQEVSCLIARGGGGVSHAIGVGGRDLGDAVGGVTTLMAMDLLDNDPGTRHVVLISKPPAKSVARRIFKRIGDSPKPYTVCFIGDGDMTLRAAADSALGGAARVFDATGLAVPVTGRRVVGLFSGGTLCAEAQCVFQAAGPPVASNAPIPGAVAVAEAGEGHVFIDLGADEYTKGRLHPMIDPAVRDAALRDALGDAAVGVVLLDVVIGYGAHDDPAGHIAALLARARTERPAIVASVTGTDGDPQNRAAQVATLEAAGVLVAPSNADAAALALACLEG